MVIDIHGKERTDTNQILVDMVKGTCALTPMVKFSNIYTCNKSWENLMNRCIFLGRSW